MTTSFIRALAAIALLISATATANAQAATQSGTASSVATPWAALPAGVYKLEITLPGQVMPATITIKDSSGVAAATFQPESEPDAQPVKITVKSAELFVNGDAPKGPFEIVLQHQGPEITGRWSYAGDTGKLTGKIQPEISK